MPWIRRRPKLPNPMWGFEQTTVPAEAAQPGLVRLYHPGLVTLLLWIPFNVVLWKLYGPLAPFLALALSRLLLLDLTCYLLPNLYTYPLIAAGVAWAWGQGYGPYSTVLVIIILLLRTFTLRHPGLKAGIGGGDFALLAALACWLEPQMMFFALAIGCFIWLPVTFVVPKRAIPLGIPIILGWLGFITIFSRLGLL